MHSRVLCCLRGPGTAGNQDTPHYHKVPARLGPLLSTLVEISVTHPRPQLMLHAAEVHRNASAGNRARVTSMAAMYSTTRPLNFFPPSAVCIHHPPLPPAVKGLVKERPRLRECLRGLGTAAEYTQQGSSWQTFGVLG